MSIRARVLLGLATAWLVSGCAAEAHEGAANPSSGAPAGATDGPGSPPSTAGAVGVAGEGGSATSVGEGGYIDPSGPGPYPVGNLTRILVDESRPETYTTDPMDRRTLVTEIWYPAAAEAALQEKDTMAGFMVSEDDALFMSLITMVFGLDAARYEELRALRTGSVRDAAIAEEGGPFPIVLFSHGNGGFRYQSTFLVERLASHGYIVVSADHTGNALVSDLPSEKVAYNPLSATGLAGRVADMRFLLDTMIALDADDPEGRFQGRVDTEHVGMTGHSFGGVTTGGTIAADDRIDVGAPMAGLIFATNVTIPMMYMLATEDMFGAALNSSIEQNYQASSGPRWLASLVDAGHFSFSDVCLLNPSYTESCATPGTRADGSTFDYLDPDRAHAITSFYQTALYGYYLKGASEYAQDLATNEFDADLRLESASAL